MICCFFFNQKPEEGKRSSLQWCCSRRLPCGLRMYWMAWPNCTTLDCGLLSIQRLEPHPEVFHICDICPCPWESKVFVVGIAAPMPLKSLNGINNMNWLWKHWNWPGSQLTQVGECARTRVPTQLPPVIDLSKPLQSKHRRGEFAGQSGAFVLWISF